MKNIGILSYLVEMDIGGKEKGLLLVETCYAQFFVVRYFGMPGFCIN
jgi:hypothetical protein